ncbi:MAG: 50S ribosomal protein L4 [Bdellovibrionota bacterium]
METVKIPVVDLKGKQVGDFVAAGELFAIEPNEAAVHFVCEGQRFRFYKKTASVKTRSAVNGGGKKVYKQKGTGGARHGGRRAPIFVGGGVTFGPKPIKRDFKINKKMYRLALASVLSDRFSSGQIRVLKGSLSAPKTSTIQDLIDGLSYSSARVGFVVSAAEDSALAKSARNIKNVDLLTEEKWTTFDFVKTDGLIFSEGAIKSLVERFQA